jgi:hypothetical protein
MGYPHFRRYRNMARTDRPAKNRAFTINNPNMGDIRNKQKLETNPQVNPLIMREEEASTGTPHFQRYVEFEERKGPNQVK